MKEIILPEPVLTGRISLEEAIYGRISRRSFPERGLTLALVGQLLWSAGGRGARGAAGVSRAAPSAGATYPLELYLATGAVEGLDAGLYRYLYHNHALNRRHQADLRAALARASLGQEMLLQAPATVIIAACYERTTRRYGKRGYRYVYMEAGSVSENIYLQAEALRLSTVAVGAFDDSGVKKILGVEEAPLLLMPVGLRHKQEKL
ncbi:MAG: SagB/ThcOx family dehydrogenase [Firmicutes bacterium]|nr:SagB/ThcOx family dehydrogenase [Bacillota bacterium]